MTCPGAKRRLQFAYIVGIVRRTSELRDTAEPWGRQSAVTRAYPRSEVKERISERDPMQLASLAYATGMVAIVSQEFEPCEQPIKTMMKGVTPTIFSFNACSQRGVAS